MSMNTITESFFTYNEFENSIKTAIDMAHREAMLSEVLDSEIYYSPFEHYVNLLGRFFSEEQSNYGDEFYEYWDNWEDMVESAIISFIFGVCNEKGEIVAPTNHELRLLDGSEVPMNSAGDLWKICTGQISVKERFA